MLDLRELSPDIAVVAAKRAKTLMLDTILRHVTAADVYDVSVISQGERALERTRARIGFIKLTSSALALLATHSPHQLGYDQ
ncbi:hypothetical protein AOT83_04285 [Mycobacteroides sp. H001]|nr:hypothetical protein AOT86_02115 [Mycobacteroides sp. H072]KRQ35816.1 hypothetical protein AOT84_14985 [Mycobacteroides sp. H002]KRQ50643.1 hypothetical protein AOT85_14235 [Mycobacteroides sp. H054]KRQ72595.1 hypothetical protein AOT83_04285 [Mycobacteroides sp. H001]OHT67489.1 hypothetical protein BKG66_22705 [Mycobacteroides chelonae]